MRYAFVFIFVLLSTLANSQDISGIWRGSFKSANRFLDMFNTEDSYKLEVQIDQLNKKFNGVTYSYKTTVFYGKAVANGTVNTKTGKVYLEELKIVEVKMMDNSYACVMIYKLQYSKSNNEEFLEGTYSSYREADSSNCGKGTVYLRKVTTSDFYKEPFLAKHERKKKSPATSPSITPKARTAPPVTKSDRSKVPPKTESGKPPVNANKSKITPPVVQSPKPKAPATTKQEPKPLAKAGPETNTVKRDPVPMPKTLNSKTPPGVINQDTAAKSMSIVKKAAPVNIPKVLTARENELVQTITVNSKDVFINIYDNGTIDHDTVSVYLDKQLVVSKQMLTTAPITINLQLDDVNAYHELVMVAENLGDIPPNTSLMVVKAGGKDYEVRITSTAQKNAVVIFKYEKPGM